MCGCYDRVDGAKRLPAAKSPGRRSGDSIGQVTFAMINQQSSFLLDFEGKGIGIHRPAACSDQEIFKESIFPSSSTQVGSSIGSVKFHRG